MNGTIRSVPARERGARSEAAARGGRARGRAGGARRGARTCERAHRAHRERLAVHLGEEEVEGRARHHDVHRRRRVLAHVVLDQLAVADLVGGEAARAVPAEQRVDRGLALLLARELHAGDHGAEQRRALPHPAVHLALDEQPFQPGVLRRLRRLRLRRRHGRRAKFAPRRRGRRRRRLRGDARRQRAQRSYAASQHAFASPAS